MAKIFFLRSLVAQMLVGLVFWSSAFGMAVTRADYYRRLAETAEQLRAAAAHTEPAELKKVLAEVRERTPVNQTVENQGATAHADYTWLYETLHSVEAEPRPDRRKEALLHAAERLEALLPQTEDTAPPVVTGDEAQQGLKRILRRAEFQFHTGQGDSNPFAALLQRILEWLIAKIFGVHNRATRLPIIQILYGLAVITLLALMISYVRSAWYRSPTLSLGPSSEFAPAASSALSFSSLLAQAMRYAAAGNYRWAMRFLYLAALAALAERGLIRLDERKTNREYLREMKGKESRAAVIGSFTHMTEDFDRVWYGEQACSETQYKEYLDRYQSLQAHVAGPRSG